MEEGGGPAPHVKQRKALDAIRSPAVQQIVGALGETASAYEDNRAQIAVRRAAVAAAAGRAGISADFSQEVILVRVTMTMTMIRLIRFLGPLANSEEVEAEVEEKGEKREKVDWEQQEPKE